ncbi:MAG TPA: hypothetical protein VE077_18505 [Candidatus Methylomirabilis sp.]|nr:hypothetical protein [Candidatus Methylomirabilis sp.]
MREHRGKRSEATCTLEQYAFRNSAVQLDGLREIIKVAKPWRAFVYIPRGELIALAGEP